MVSARIAPATSTWSFLWTLAKPVLFSRSRWRKFNRHWRKQETKEQMAAVLVDLGGTHLRCGLWREPEPARVMQRRRIRSFVDGVSNDQIWEEIVTTVTEFS